MNCEDKFSDSVNDNILQISEPDADEDVLSSVVRKQEAALKRLEQKHGSGYGKPPPGSQSEARAKKYNENCVREIIELCAIISERGFTEDQSGKRAILFGDLFNAYRFISDKCCGLLLRARRYKLLSFEGEMLFQGKDDKTVITMNRSFSEIHGFYKDTKTLIGPEDVYIQPKQVLKKVRKKVSRKGSRGSSFRAKDKEKTLSTRERDGKSNKT